MFHDDQKTINTVTSFKYFFEGKKETDQSSLLYQSQMEKPVIMCHTRKVLIYLKPTSWLAHMF